jgi:acetyl esterase/lipase
MHDLQVFGVAQRSRRPSVFLPIPIMSMRHLLALPVISLALLARAAAADSAPPAAPATMAPTVAPATADAPFALMTLTPAQINGSSPFFTLDRAATPNLIATPPARLEDLQVLRLWSGPAPLQQGENPATDIPTLTVFLPATGKANGAAMIVFPGGAYSHLSPREGLPAAQWLASHGITVFILKSRLGMKYHHPAEMDDAQRSIRYVRANAAAWGLDPKRIGIIGFSAGGHLASTAATHFDAGDAQSSDPIERASSRPDVQILGYPVLTLVDETLVHKPSRTWLVGNNAAPEILEFLSAEKHVTAETPPAFVFTSTGDTTVPPANSDQYVAALIKNNIPVVYLREPIGKHGYGITDDWAPQAMAWLHTQKF